MGPAQRRAYLSNRLAGMTRKVQSMILIATPLQYKMRVFVSILGERHPPSRNLMSLPC